jgi:O-antigen ligase
MLGVVLIAMVSLSWRGYLLSGLKGLWPFHLLILSFLAATLAHGQNRFHAVEPVFYALYFLVFGFAGHFIHRRGLAQVSVKSLTLIAAIACFFYAGMTITVYLFAVTDNFARLDHLIPWGFVSIRYWSHIATWLLPLFPLAVLAGPLKEHRLWQFGVGFTAAVWWWMVIMSSSRGSMVGLAFGFVFVWVFFGKAALPWAKLSLKFVGYGLIAWLVLSLLIPSLVFDEIQVRGIKGDSSGRMPLWQEAWAMSLQNFPFGMGPQSWLTHEILTSEYEASKKFGHPHNMYLMWAAEYGWVAIAGLLVLMGHALRRLWFRRSEVQRGVYGYPLALVAFTASVVAAMVHAGVSAVFIAPGSMLVGLLVLSVFWALIQPAAFDGPLSTEKKGSTGRSRIFASALVIAVGVGSGLWLKQVWEYHQAMVEDLPYYQRNVSLGHLPRFWFHGYFPRQPGLMPRGE